ncbi:MAG TPA: shikimate kinase, partial [Solirubrobacteraceae bacterium]|nr:shikimate kinase [Solirubrobacteraceae bacterium]
MTPEPALVFIGFMGAGKTTAGRAAAAALGATAVDADDVIEERLGHPIAEHFAAHGEASFRAVEEEVVCALLAAPPGPVLALGGVFELRAFGLVPGLGSHVS